MGHYNDEVVYKIFMNFFLPKLDFLLFFISNGKLTFAFCCIKRFDEWICVIRCNLEIMKHSLD